ncbi:hypothetical protein V2J09_005373 [Rumex salicifolius]
MAEALFGVASKLLVTIGSPAFEKAYEKASSIKNAQKDLKKLEASIGTIRAGLLDAEKKQDSSTLVKDWIKRVRDVLYDADDLFDEVATDEMLRKQIEENKLKKEVCSCFTSSSLNPFTISRNSVVAKKVKDIRKSLDEISKDMRDFQIVECRNESPIGGMRQGQDPGLLFIDSEKVIGRDKDKKAILEMLVAESSTDVSVIVVVGIGGMGKTTLAQLVYKDDEVQRTFGESKWFVCISDTSVDKEVIGKICQSTCGVEKYEDLSIIDLQNRIREKMKGRKFLLVLDDVWDDSSDRWDARMDIWRRGAKGSKVIVTTRSRSVAKAVGASETYHLRGLSEEQSWDLFKRVARITPEKERDSRWNDLGREFVRKGANVPLAIRSIASLLAEKNTIEEWELFRNNELPKLGQTQENGIMPVLRLSYDHLASHLKPCFAYCSLFPKDHIFDKDDLIDLWASQGYIKTTNDSQRIEDMDDSWADPHPLRLRSFLYEGGYKSSCKLTLEKQFANFKCLRALKLSSLRIEIVPSSIGELKHLRYLDISRNKFNRLPDAITNLVNLCMLNISRCFKLEVLPNQFSKLVNLRGLLNRGCGLNHMPLGFDRLISLQRLDEFIVSRKTDGGQGSNLHELAGLELRNKLSIIFNDETVDWDGVDSWKLSPHLQFLEIVHYSGNLNWGNEAYLLPTLTSLHLYDCSRVKCLPSLRHLPNLNVLTLRGMDELEYIQGDEEEEKLSPNAIFLPDLKKLEFEYLKKLKGWSRKVEEATRSKEEHAATCTPHTLSFPSLLQLTIQECPELNHMLLCPRLGELFLESVKAKVIHQLLLPIHGNSFPSNTTTPSSSLQSVVIKNCHDLVSFPGESFTSLQRLCINGCTKLNKVQLAPLGSNILEKLALLSCPKLELWEENKRGVDWDSLPKLTTLTLNEVPSSEKLPDCLRKRKAHFRLTINVSFYKFQPAVFGIASVTLATIASPAVRSAYEKAVSVRKAQADLDKLKRSIKTIQAVLLDAEKKQDSSAAIRDWIKRVRDVLYDADDLFDEVATDDMLRKQIEENKLKKEVWSSFTSSTLNPFTSSRNSVVAKKVKDIRKSLDEISEDMKAFRFAECRNERPIGESEKVIGRDKEKKAIIEMLVAESMILERFLGKIGGLYPFLIHPMIKKSLKKSLTPIDIWAPVRIISHLFLRIHIQKNLHNSTCGGRYKGLSIIDLQNRIREKMKGKKFLLVLDDVWDHDRARWTDRMGLLSEGGKGSKVIVTTRSESVARAVGAVAMATHHLDGLSEEDSWDLFKSIVGFTQEQERDSTWANLGRQIVKKCANVPLAVKSIASLLFEKSTIREWESFKNEELSNLGQDHEDGIMPVLRLSYEHLSSNLKHCFAYCSLFPKNYEFDKDVLIYLWISQGYIEAKSDKQNIEDIDDSWTDLHPLLNVNRLRSFLYQEGYSSSCKLTLEKQFANFKCLRALSVISLDIETIPSSIGDLKHLRYLDISGNAFRTLPDAFTKLVNMWTLNLRCCQKLEALPNQFRKLTNLRGLLNRDCDTLMQIPPGFEELTSLQTLDEFRVSKEFDGGQRSKLDVLCRLKLRGELRISFREETDDWDGVECWKPSPFLQGLWIDDYKGNRIPHWGNKMTDNQASLTTLSLIGCSRVKCPNAIFIPN